MGRSKRLFTVHMDNKFPKKLPGNNTPDFTKVLVIGISVFLLLVFIVRWLRHQ